MDTFIGTAFVVVFVTYAIALYNRLIAYRNRVRETWTAVDAQLKRRHDLIPDMIETARGAAFPDQDILDRVQAARDSAAAGTGDAAHRARSEGELQSALKDLFARAEPKADMTANQNVLAFRHQLADIEDQIERARRDYNDSAEAMNDLLAQFPSNVVARRFSIETAPVFVLEPTPGNARNP